MRELPIKDVASRLGKSEKQVRRYLAAGVLNSVKKTVNGRPATFVFWVEGMEKELEARKTGTYQEPQFLPTPQLQVVSKSHKGLLPEWELWATQGFLSDKPMSIETISLYKRYLVRYFEKNQVVSPEGLVNVVSAYPVEQYGVRKMFYSSVVCFAKYLVKKQIETEALPESLKAFKPRRSGKPKRTVLTEKQIPELFKHIDSYEHFSPSRRATNKAIVATLLYTGIRNSELRTLQLDKIDLDGKQDGNRRMSVHGKGNKWRPVGLTQELASILKDYLRFRPDSPSPYLFLNEAGKQYTRDEIARKIRNLREELNLDITPHSFRRTFVTQAVKRGKSLLLIKDAVGHEDIKITQIYSQLGNDDVVEAMQNW